MNENENNATSSESNAEVNIGVNDSIDSGGQTNDEPEITYANDKYKSVSDLEKGYLELQKSYSQKLGKFDGAPEQYSINDTISEDDPMYEFAKEWGKENQLNNGGLNNLVEKYNEFNNNKVEEYKKEQLSALGDNANERISNVADFLKANTNIDDQSMEQINQGLLGAQGLEVLESLISMSKVKAVAQNVQQHVPDDLELRNMRFALDSNGNRRMSTDPAYREKVEKMERDSWFK